MTATKEWIEGLKEGDKVALYNRRWGISTVTRVTNCRIMAGGLTFDRKTGKEYGGSGWNFGSIRPLTQTFVDERKEHDRRIKAQKAFKEIDYLKLTTDQLEAIVAIVNAKETA